LKSPTGTLALQARRAGRARLRGEGSSSKEEREAFECSRAVVAVVRAQIAAAMMELEEAQGVLDVSEERKAAVGYLLRNPGR